MSDPIYSSDTYLKVSVRSAGYGLEGCISCHRKSNNKLIWVNGSSIFRPSNDDGFKDAAKDAKNLLEDTFVANSVEIDVEYAV